jgi:hypothetical protein
LFGSSKPRYSEIIVFKRKSVDFFTAVHNSDDEPIIEKKQNCAIELEFGEV